MDKKEALLITTLGAAGALAGFVGAAPAGAKVAEASCSQEFGICSCGQCCSGGGCLECYNRLEPAQCQGWGGGCTVVSLCHGVSGGY
jgi:hypothetical protein